MSQEPRCATCGALVSADAEWCGQCYAPLQPAGTPAKSEVAPTTAAAIRAAAGRGIEVEDGRTMWTCPACDTRNPIEADLCAACNTPFGRLFEEREVRPEVDPQTAAVWSMVLPGLGHWRLGRKGDAIARFAMFGWAFGALLLLLVSRFGKGGLGPTYPLFLMFLLAALTIYVLSVVDAYRIAADGPPIVSPRALLWGSVGLIVLSILIATFVTLPAARQ
ncbi:MAG TPA: zinc ribbon domain-containing protein [Actinomycetota bacterium]|nr:zinc ribbon domain-containing protein [Actinomycetota bacterium]